MSEGARVAEGEGKAARVFLATFLPLEDLDEGYAALLYAYGCALVS